MKAYQYFNEHGQIITQILNEPMDFLNSGKTTNDPLEEATDEGRRASLAAMHKRFKHFRRCTDGYWRDPKQCIEKKQK